MSEASSRLPASRGRGSSRGSRRAFAGRGGRKANGDRFEHKSNGDALHASDDAEAFGDLRKQYGDKTSVIREMFPDWSEADVLFALQETDGDQNEAVARIAEGTISQWGQVSKVKKPSRVKGPDSTSASTVAESTPHAVRSGRGGRNAVEGSRGRGRGSERAGRGNRSRLPHDVNGARSKESQSLSVPTVESPVWTGDNSKPTRAQSKIGKTDFVVNPPADPKPAAPQVKTWASMLRQSTAPKPAPSSTEPSSSTSSNVGASAQAASSALSLELEAQQGATGETTPVASRATPKQLSSAGEAESLLPPAKNELTETNLEQVVDESRPPATETAASTAADSWDPRQSFRSAAVTPLSASQQQHQASRSATSGYAASAVKATADRYSRSSSYQRRVLDQEEAVRMPSNREVDRAAVQFGAFSLASGDEDIDGERENPETRAQPPADSPVAHPRASLPPASQPVAVPEAYPPKPVSAAAATAARPGTVRPGESILGRFSDIVTAPTAPAAHMQAANPVATAQHYGRFGHGHSHDTAPAVQKSLDPFSQHSGSASQPPFDGYSGQTHPAQAQQAGAAYGSNPNDYPSHYSMSHQDRNSYNYYAQHYATQQGTHGHDGGAQAAQRPLGSYQAQSDNLSKYPQSGVMQSQPRFGGSSDSQNSGHSTPNPTAPTQPAQHNHQVAQGLQQHAPTAHQQGAAAAQPQSHGQQYAGFSHPYYSNPYYHQYYSGYGQGGFGPYGKAGMYDQPYGVSPNAPYDHSSSSGNYGPSSLHRDSGLGSGLGDYGRSGSGPATNQPGHGGSSFGAGHDAVARGASTFSSQGQNLGSQGQPIAGVSDDLKPFNEKSGAGPSPSLGSNVRPGSTANAATGGQGGLPGPQSSQMGGAGYGGYPSHLQGHGLHGGGGGGGGGYGMGGNAAASQHGSTPYGSYGQGFGSSGYYGGGQQQRGGWGGNYH